MCVALRRAMKARTCSDRSMNEGVSIVHQKFGWAPTLRDGLGNR